MSDSFPLLPALLAMSALAAGTFLLRLAGPALRAKVAFPKQAEKLLEVSAVVLLAALTATAALTQGEGFAGAARALGVLVGGVLAWRGAPFLAVVIAAAGTAALLRLIGIP
ncbi:AzlD domain-containing protein [Streptomyces sp. NPDC020875]|uniref:AzlD domain-containing protein n=1 Tax=Streptomyces sp. NPDC020875 TaxID=3154898 RepID=UPI0033E37950